MTKTFKNLDDIIQLNKDQFMLDLENMEVFHPSNVDIVCEVEYPATIKQIDQAVLTLKDMV